MDQDEAIIDDDEKISASPPNPYPNPNPDPCPICLGRTSQESYLDRCFHKFCYKCIIRWTKVVSSRSSSSCQKSSVKCPLCKTENSSIIFGYDGSTFQRHFINQINGNSTFFSKDHMYRLQCYCKPEPALLSDTFKVERYWKFQKYLQSNIWVEKWLKRELQALVQEEDVEIIKHHILGVIESFSRSYQPKGKTYSPHLKQDEFKVLVADAAMPFLTARTKHFVNEIELFLASGLTVEAFDRAYKRCVGWNKPGEISEDYDRTSSETVAPCLYCFDDDSDEVDWAEDEPV